ncbi:hypothetical protein [Adhaeribacter radiodurans]|uniref:Uncharacterized protein n=1 Tax=Adhaeribacter radiodurans TaxID=2745197 RepID=A0A7L7L684_9BACT|nr:hypothetical protein [Adhaeribacter radiodurans]QMU28346.1 hypothetical protein HUW48_10010 [Adhaeribacter radiodurans]
MMPVNEGHFHTEWIERYLAGELQGEELENFIHRLHSDNAFRQEVAVQRSIVDQAQLVGRQDLQQQLKSLHRQLGFAEVKSKSVSYTNYGVAASILILLTAAFVFYFIYQPNSRTPVLSQVKEEKLLKKPLIIRYQVKEQDPTLGFSGATSDSTTTILLYQSSISAYQFDDTLRLYGNFTASQLTLQYNQAKEQYTLLVDSIGYPLQRYRPKQSLKR